MAESKRSAAAGAEEAYDLPVPPFDPEAYVRKERIGARAVVVLSLYGLVLGQVGAIVSHNWNPIVALAVFFFGMTGIKAVMEATGVDYKEWDRKAWAGNVALLFFTWLAAWILFINPPFLA